MVIRALKYGEELKVAGGGRADIPDRRDYLEREKQVRVAACTYLSDGYRSCNYSVRKASMGSVFAALRAGIMAATNAAAARTTVVINRTRGS